MKPLAVDLFCGLGGWADGLLAEGFAVVGFDIERHEYGEHRYPAQLVIQDVLTLHGAQFRDAALIVASPPCQAYSYRAMPWSRDADHVAGQASSEDRDWRAVECKPPELYRIAGVGRIRPG
jgi:site-specific DNA-cytosine methylase